MPFHGRQFLLLLWKGMITRKRHYFMTASELALPILLGCFFVYLRTIANDQSASEFNPPRVSPAVDPIQDYANNPITLLYTPNNDLTTKLTLEAVKLLPERRLATIPQGLNSESQLVSVAQSVQASGNITSVLGLVYHNLLDDNILPKVLKYKIRSDTKDFQTADKYPGLSLGGPSFIPNPYSISGFLALQSSIQTTFIKLQTEGKPEQPKMLFYVQKLVYPSYYESSIGTLYSFVSQILVYGLIFVMLFFVKRIVEEKANRAKEMMRMMGLNDMVYFGGTFTNTFLVLFLDLTIIIILFKIPFTNGVSVYTYSDGFLLWVLFMLYAVNALLFCMALSTIFNKPVVGSIITAIAWSASFSVIAYVLDPPGQSDKYLSVTRGQKLASSIMPNPAIHWALRIVSFYEGIQEGANWSNINKIPLGDNFSLAMVMGMMIVSSFIFAFITWYVDNVWPWQFGIPKHPLYFLMPSYWCPVKQNMKDLAKDIVHPNVDKTYFEDEPNNMNAGISVSGLTKAFGFGKNRKVAVNGVSLNMYHGQITALLGHNGAGKTTTMNIITGLFPPSSGSATVNGYSVLANLKQARESLGLCPQHNVLYDTLTVEEHLIFFAGLKGRTFAEAKKEIARWLALLQLEGKRNELSKTLSGGMKRKLSLGIAVIGGSQVLVLDEPTAGMDPQARRAIWDMLQQIRSERTIVLTTHYMEEADILGDRIAIMAEGVVQCCGSPLFLKRKFGAGYHLRVAKGEKFYPEGLREVVQRNITSAYVDNDTPTEISYVLPVSDSQTFVTMFESLESDKPKIGYTACGLTITTMEDVFLKVGQLAEERDGVSNDWQPDETNQQIDVSTFQTKRSSHLMGFPLWCQQVRALLTKRFHHARRYVPFLVFLVVIPLIITFMMLSTKNSITITFDQKIPLLRLKLGEIFGPTDAYYSNKTDEGQFGSRVVQSLVSVMKDASANPKPSNNITDDVLKVAQANLLKYKRELLIAGEVAETSSGTRMTAMYNGEVLHVSAITLNMMANAALKAATNDSNAGFELENEPLQNYGTSVDITRITGEISKMMFSFYLPLALSFMSSSFVLFPIHERITKSKLIQLMTGVDGLTFWLCHFAWDFLMQVFSSCFIIIPFVALDQVGSYGSGTGAVGALFLLLVFYGWSSIPMSYLLSFISKKPATGFTIATAINFLSGMILSMALIIYKLILTGQHSDTSVVDNIAWVARILPNFALTWGAANMDYLAGQNMFCDVPKKEVLDYVCANAESQILAKNPYIACCPGVCESLNNCFVKRSLTGMDPDQCGRDLLMMFIFGVVFFGLLTLLESNVIRFWYRFRDSKKKPVLVNQTAPMLLQRQFSVPGVGEDSDVAEERNRVEYLHQNGQSQQEALLVHNLTKNFGNINAVDHITFSVHHNECFGLLGVNGAGKTTTFSMLTGDLSLDEGTAFVGLYNIIDHLKLFQRQVGYCPQFDALLDRMTGREALYMFARLRGVPERDIPKAVSELIEIVDLQAHADKGAEKYSGGNRRKLSLALSLVGSPPVIFLDEPTAGVDPASRRKIWASFTEVQKHGGTSFILTTHSMEECEALCGRLVIMVNGKFRCLGPIQYLKSKFGQGYTIIVKLQKEQHLDEAAAQNVMQFFQDTFPGSVLKDAHQGMLHYHIVDTRYTWSVLFREMENAKRTFQLEDYLISDTTLEQIFLTFAKTQRIVSAT